MGLDRQTDRFIQVGPRGHTIPYKIKEDKLIVSDQEDLQVQRDSQDYTGSRGQTGLQYA
jgi:hypothetical protein